jgi:hypothetical protein
VTYNGCDSAIGDATYSWTFECKQHKNEGESSKSRIVVKEYSCLEELIEEDGPLLAVEYNLLDSEACKRMVNTLKGEGLL